MKQAFSYVSYLILLFVAFQVLQYYQGPLLAQTKNGSRSSVFSFIVDDSATPPVSGPIIESLDSWKQLISEPGLTIFKEENSLKNYLTVVDPNQKQITVQNLYGHMDDQWNNAKSPICIFNAGFFEPDGTSTFPIIEDGNFIPGQKTGQFPARILYLNQSSLTVSDIASNSEVGAAQQAIAGLRPSYYVGDGTITNRILIGTKDNLLYILVTQDRTIDKLVIFMSGTLGIDAKDIIALDSGFSTQFRCHGEDYISSLSILGSTIVISNQ